MDTHGAVSNAARTNQQTHNPLIKMLREFTSQSSACVLTIDCMEFNQHAFQP